MGIYADNCTKYHTTLYATWPDAYSNNQTINILEIYIGCLHVTEQGARISNTAFAKCIVTRPHTPSLECVDTMWKWWGNP